MSDTGQRQGLEHLTRDGHLSDLTIDRYLGEPAGDLHAAVDAHAEGCSICRERIVTVRRFDAGNSIAPRWPATMDGPGATVVQLVPRRDWRPNRRWAAAAGLLAAAASLVLLTRVGVGPDETDVWRSKGGPFDLEVWVHDGERARLVVSGDVVHPQDRVGFRLDLREGGHILIIGVDGQGQAYVGYPQGLKGQSERVSATPEPMVLDEALRFDGILGLERIVGLFCPSEVAMSNFANRLQELSQKLPASTALPLLVQGCRQKETILRKEAHQDAAR